MKSTSIRLKQLSLFIALAFCNVLVWAQDSGSSAATTTTTTNTSVTERTWYTEPWAWIVGGAVLLLLIIALLRGGSSGRSDRVTVTKTVSTDSDI